MRRPEAARAGAAMFFVATVMLAAASASGEATARNVRNVGVFALVQSAVAAPTGQSLSGRWLYSRERATGRSASGRGVGVPWGSLMHRVPPDWRGSGWFRARVDVPASLQGKRLALALRHRASVDIYVDGAVVARFGQAHDSAPPAACFNPRIVYVTFTRPSHVVTVRVASHWARRLAWLGYGGGFDVAVSFADGSERYWRDQTRSATRLHTLFYGVTLGLAGLHFLLFLFHRERPGNLYFAIAAAAIAAIARGVDMSGYATRADDIVNGIALFNSSVVVACVFSQRFYYQIFRDRPPRYFVAFAVVGALLVAGAFWLPFVVVYAFAMASFADQLVSLVVAAKRRRRGAAIVGAGGVIAILATAHAILADLEVLPGSTESYLFGFLALFASMSLHLAREIATDKRALVRQVVEIQRLSREALDREREAADARLAREVAAADNKQRALQLAEAKKRQAAVDELRRANEELSRTQAQLVQTEKMASLGGLVDGVAREIGEPVGRILERARDLREAHAMFGATLDALDARDGRDATSATTAATWRADRKLVRSHDALAEAARVIEDGGARVAAIADRLAAFARVDISQREPLALAEVIAAALAPLEQQIEAAGVTLTREGADAAPMVFGHRRQLITLLRQLLENALQAIAARSGASSIHVRVSPAEGGEAEHRVDVAVADDGAGVDLADRARIFDPGFTTRGVGVGAGLGLAIAYRIARAHGGDLRLEEREPPGATFVVSLPRPTSS